MAASPGMPWRPAAFTRGQRRLNARLVAEARGKSLALRRLRSGSGRGGCSGRGRQSQSLLARQVGLLDALLSLQQAVLRLQSPVVQALCARAFDLLRLQLLHALLQAIDPGLPLRGLARQRLALPLLRHLLALLDELLMLLRTLLDPLLPLAQLRRAGA